MKKYRVIVDGTEYEVGVEPLSAAPSAPNNPAPQAAPEIGRASCRERVYSGV